MGDTLLTDEMCQCITAGSAAGKTRAAPDARAVAISEAAASKLSDANCRMREPGAIASRSMWAAARLGMPLCVTATPFGVPVEPVGVDDVGGVLRCEVGGGSGCGLLCDGGPVGIEADHVGVMGRRRPGDRLSPDVPRTDRKISIIEQFRLAAGAVCSHAKEQPVGCSSGASRWP